jgi:hypothetical protein
VFASEITAAAGIATTAATAKPLGEILVKEK